MTNTYTFTLGRRQEFDERSRAFGIRQLVEAFPPRSYTWSCESYLDQGAEGACVGFSITHEINARPKVVPVTDFLARLIYHEAQKIDPWPGENYEGTSVLAGIKTAAKMGYFTEYRWAFSFEDLVLAIGYKGPAVLGIDWYEGMFDPEADGTLHLTGQIAGGHAILANGVSIKKRQVRLHNSWGSNWGLGGDAFIGFDDLAKLLSDGGEACIPVIRTVPG